MKCDITNREIDEMPNISFSHGISVAELEVCSGFRIGFVISQASECNIFFSSKQILLQLLHLVICVEQKIQHP